MKVAVIIPTYGRKALVHRMLIHLAQQSHWPHQVILSAPDISHIPDDLSSLDLPVLVTLGARGSAAQRNTGMRAVDADVEVVVFFDDDFLPASDFLEHLVDAFEKHPDWAVLTGDVLRDGATTNGISFEDGEAILQASHRRDVDSATPVVCHGAYGCNMAFRASAISDEEFDERLVLYGWQEDVDFSRRVGARGLIIRLPALRGVHLGVKSGRVSGVRFGYSQVINPIYLVRKGTLPASIAATLMLRNVVANLARSLFSESWVDRRGRLLGNFFGFCHLMRGRIEPERAVEL